MKSPSEYPPAAVSLRSLEEVRVVADDRGEARVEEDAGARPLLGRGLVLVLVAPVQQRDEVRRSASTQAVGEGGHPRT